MRTFFNAASQAKAELLKTYPDFDLTIIDSKCADIGFDLVVMYVGMMYQSNAGKQEIIDAVYYHCKQMNHVFTVDTLEYLLKGGRISKTYAIAGDLLDIRPIIVEDENGNSKVIEKECGRKKSLSRLTEYVREYGTEFPRQVIGIVHGDDREALSIVRKNLEERYVVAQVISKYVKL